MGMPVAHLEDRAVIAVTGPEARPFLQGLITNDVERLAPGIGLYAALLTPQGKILFDFFLVEGDGAILVDCSADARDALLKRLTMYKLQANVAISDASADYKVLVLWGKDACSSGETVGTVAFDDPRLSGMGLRILAEARFATDIASATNGLRSCRQSSRAWEETLSHETGSNRPR